MKSKSLIGGTIILVSANFISKILGAILKIPLTYILGEEGMAIYHTTFSIYITVLFLVTSGIPFAVSKYISEELALSHEGTVKKAIKISLIIMSFLGIAGSIILFFGAEFFSLSMKDPKAIMPTKAIAPSVLFVAVGCIYKSVFEAYQNMVPTAISQVIESFIKLVLGFTFALWLSSFTITYAVSGAVFSITLGELIATLILFLLYLPYSKKLKNTPEINTSKEVVTAIFSVAVPMMITSIISSSFSLLETSIIRNRLLDITFTKATAEKFLATYAPFTDIFNHITNTLKMDIDGARWLFGAYSGYAATVFNLPIGILASFGVTVVPVITKCVALKNYTKVNEVVLTVTKILLLLSLPCAVIFIMYPEEILYILFKNTASAAMLRLMSPTLIIISISNIISASLFATGKIAIPFINETIAVIVKIILLYFLIVIPDINITGVIISSFFANLLLLFLNMNIAKKHLKLHFLPLSFVIKSLLSAVCMGIICYVIKSNYYIVNNIYAFIIAAIISVTIYFILILLFGIVSKKEIKSYA